MYLRGNAEHFDMFDSYIYVNSDRNGMYYYVSMVTVVTRTRHVISLYAHWLSFCRKKKYTA